MLNKNDQRELVYISKVEDIRPIEGKDRVECAVVGGWTVMVRKGQFEVGDLGIYFEIDSKVPETEPFEFLASKHYRIKTQKYGNFYSQGLLMHPNDFGWEVQIEPLGGVRTEVIIDDEGKPHYEDDESRFLTEKLGVVYSVAEDNERKSKAVDKYQKMAQRMDKKFSKQPYIWLMRRMWGKKFLYFIYGKASDTQGFPNWVTQTDEERVENMTYIFDNKDPWVATEKIDGTSTTFTMKRTGKKREPYIFIVCSRNVAFVKLDTQLFSGNNVYTEMAEKYNIEAHMKDMLETHPEWKFVTIQGETYGRGIQKNTYDIDDHRFMAFNIVTSDKGRWDTLSMAKYLEAYDIPCVPIVDTTYILPDTIEELREYVHSKPSVVNGKLREGIVFRQVEQKTGRILSFKCVDPDYLIK